MRKSVSSETIPTSEVVALAASLADAKCAAPALASIDRHIAALARMDAACSELIDWIDAILAESAARIGGD